MSWGVYKWIEPAPKPIPVEETFHKALVMLNSNEVDKVRKGESIMDSLSKMRHVQAMYELARTYGWYKDTISLNRKKALGIEHSKDGMPISDKYNAKAIELYSNILDLNDSTSNWMKANVAFRLAIYYNNPNNVYRTDHQKAKEYLMIAQKYAVESKQDSLLNIINKGIEDIDKYIKKSK